MATNKTLTYLSTFDDTDWKSFSKYSRLLFTEKSDLYELFQYFKKNKRKLQEGTIDIEQLNKKLRNDLNKKSFQNLLSDFGSQIESYFAWKEMKASDYQENQLLLKAYRKRGLFKQYNALASKMKCSIEKSETNLWNQFKLLQIDHELYLSDNPIKNKLGEDILRNSIQHFGKFINQLSSFYHCEATNRNRQNSEDWSFEIRELSKISIYPSELSELFGALSRMQNKSKPDFLKALDILKHTENKLSKEINLIVLLYLYNNIPRVFSSVKSRIVYTKELLEIGLEKNLYLQDGRMPLTRFHNIIDSACGSDMYKWANNFIDEYSEKIPKDKKEESVALGRGIILFKNPKLKDGKTDAIRLLSTQKFSDITLSLRSRAIMICCHYAVSREDKEFMNYQLNAFKTFAKRNKSKMSANGFISLINLEFYLNKLTNNIDFDFTESLKKRGNIFFKSFVMKHID